MNSNRIFNGLVAALLAIGLVEVVTGLVLFPFYKAGVGSAYGSTRSIESSAVLGPIQSLHHWLSAAMIVLGGAALLYGLVTAAYRASSRKLWVGGVFFLLLSLLLQLTGHLLPWDQHAVRTAAVETGIAENVPLAGNLQASFLRQGAEVGSGTLTLWFWAHVLILSAGFLCVGLLLRKKVRALGFSAKAFRAVAGAGLALCLLLAALDRAKLGPQAVSADYGSFDARPEWYTLPLHTLLGLANGIGQNFGFLGTMVVPGIVLVLLLAAPWIDGKFAQKKPAYGMALGLCLLVGSGILFAMSAGDMASPTGPNVAKAGEAAPANQKLDPKLVAQGEQLFAKQGCLDCHTINGKGGKVGPVLNGTGTRHPSIDWQAAHLALPKSKVPGSTMPPFGFIGQQKIQALAEYLVSLK